MSGEDRKTILLVDDEAVIAMSEQMDLERYGYAVIIANGGEEAVATFGETPGINLILMDIDLGKGMNGPEAAVAILKKRDIPVVFVSSHIEPEIVEKTERITSYGYVVKNSGITVLDASIKMAFKLFDANNKTQAVNDKLEATLAALPDLLFEVGLDGCCYDYHSPHPECRIRISADVVGKNVADIFPLHITDVVMSAIREAHEKGFSIGRQFEMNDADGLLWFEISVSRKVSTLHEPHFIILSRDITKRKCIEEDLRTHQIELKMQNDEFCGKQEELDALRSKYFDLYDLAPVSYITLSEKGFILEVNLAAATLLGGTRDALVNQPINRFIVKDDQDIFYLHRKKLLESGKPLSCELRMLLQDGTIVPVYLTAIAVQNHSVDSSYIFRVICNES